MQRTDLIKSMKKHTFNMFPDEWYNNVVNGVFEDLENKSTFGYVYFIKYQSTDAIKIGMSTNIINRLNNIKTSNTDKMFLIGYIYTEQYNSLERTLHKQYKENRLTGEWFNLNINQVINAIRENNGHVVNCLFDKKLIIEDGVVVSCGDEKINAICNDLYLSDLFDTIEKGVRHNIGSVLGLIPTEKQEDYSKKKITTSIKKYASQNGLKYFSGNSNGMRWFMLE
jgi:hypothetical protein